MKRIEVSATGFTKIVAAIAVISAVTGAAVHNSALQSVGVTIGIVTIIFGAW